MEIVTAQRAECRTRSPIALSDVGLFFRNILLLIPIPNLTTSIPKVSLTARNRTAGSTRPPHFSLDLEALLKLLQDALSAFFDLTRGQTVSRTPGRYQR